MKVNMGDSYIRPLKTIRSLKALDIYIRFNGSIFDFFWSLMTFASGCMSRAQTQSPEACFKQWLRYPVLISNESALFRAPVVKFANIPGIFGLSFAGCSS